MELATLKDVAFTVGRLLLATGIGAILGWQRERHHKPAGFRTHILVSLASAVFVLPVIHEHASIDSVARIIQGIAVGIGFIGGGCILKLPEHQRIRGLTTAGSVWVTGALGVGAAVGPVWVVGVAAILAWIVLAYLERFDADIRHGEPK